MMDASKINFLIKMSGIVLDAHSSVQDDSISSHDFPTTEKYDETEVSGSTSSKCLIEEIVDSDHGNPLEFIKASGSPERQTSAEISYKPKVQSFKSVSEKEVPLRDFELPCSSKTDFSSIRNRKKHSQKTMFHSQGVENNMKERNNGNCIAEEGKVHPKSSSRMSSGKGPSRRKGVNRKSAASASNIRNLMNDVHDPSTEHFLKKLSEKEIAIHEMAKKSKKRAREMAAKELGYVRDSASKGVTDPSLKDVDLDYSYMTDFERMLEMTDFPLSFYSPEILECGIDDSSSSSDESSLFVSSWSSEDSELDLKSQADNYSSVAKPSDSDAEYLKDIDETWKVYLEYLEYSEIIRNLERYMNKYVKRLSKLTPLLKDPRSKVKRRLPTKPHSLKHQQFINRNSSNTSDSSTNTTSDTQVLNVIKVKRSQNAGNPTDAHTSIKSIEKDENCIPMPLLPNPGGEITSHHSKDKYVHSNTAKAYGEKGGMINKDENCVPMPPDHPGEITSYYSKDKYISPNTAKAYGEKGGMINKDENCVPMPLQPNHPGEITSHYSKDKYVRSNTAKAYGEKGGMINKDENCVPMPLPPDHPGEITSYYSKDKYISPNTAKAYGEKGGMINKDENCVPMPPFPNHPGEIISLYGKGKYFSPSVTKACREKSGIINEKTKIYQMPKREDSAGLTTQEQLNYSKLKPRQINDSFLTSQKSPKTITKEPRAMFLSHCKFPKEADLNNPIILQPKKKAKTPSTLKEARNMLKKLESEVFGSHAGSNYSSTTKPNKINTARCKGKSCIDDPVVSQASQKAEAILTAMKPSVSSRSFLEKLDPSVIFPHDNNHSSTMKTNNTKATKCESESYKNNSVILQASQKTEAISTAVEPLKPSQNFLEKLEAVGFTPLAGNSHSNAVEPNRTETAKCEKQSYINNCVIPQATQKDEALSTAVKPLKSPRSCPEELEPTVPICHEGINYLNMVEPNKTKAVTHEGKSNINMPVILPSAQKAEAVSTAVKPFMSLRNFPEELEPVSISHDGSNTEQNETKAAKYEESYINNSIIPQVEQRAKAISTAVKPLKPPQSFLEKLEPVVFTSYAGSNHSNTVESNKTKTSKCERKSDINIPVILQAAQKAEGISTAVKPSTSCPEELEPTVTICHDGINYSSTVERNKGKAVRHKEKSDVNMPVIPHAAQKGISTSVKSLMSLKSFPEELDPTVSTSCDGNNHSNALETTIIKASNYERELQLPEQLDKNGENYLTDTKIIEAKPETFTLYMRDSASQLSITSLINSENRSSCCSKKYVGSQETDAHSQDICGEFQNNVESDERNDVGPNLRLSTLPVIETKSTINLTPLQVFPQWSYVSENKFHIQRVDIQSVKNARQSDGISVSKWQQCPEGDEASNNPELHSKTEHSESTLMSSALLSSSSQDSENVDSFGKDAIAFPKLLDIQVGEFTNCPETKPPVSIEKFSEKVPIGAHDLQRSLSSDNSSVALTGYEQISSTGSSTKPQYLSKEILTTVTPQDPIENTETVPYPLENSFDKSAEQFRTTRNAPIPKFVYQDLSLVRFYNTKFNDDPSESHEQNSQIHKSVPKPASAIAEKVRNLRDRYAKENLKTLFRAEKENFTKKIISAGNFLQSKYPFFGAKQKMGEEKCKQDATKGYAVNDIANVAQSDRSLSSKTEARIKASSSDRAHLNKDNLFPHEVKKSFKPRLTPLQSTENIKAGSYFVDS